MASQFQIFGAIDNPHTALTQFVQDAVMGDGLAGQVSIGVIHFSRRGSLGRSRRGRDSNHLNLTEEAISAARHGFDIARLVSRFAHHVAELLDGGVDAVIEFHDGVVRPKAKTDLVAQHHFAGMFQQHEKDLARLFAQTQADTVFAQLAGPGIELERPEPQSLSLGSSLFGHWPLSCPESNTTTTTLQAFIFHKTTR